MNYFNECSNLEEAKKLYRKLAMENHPDHGGNEDTFKDINNQFEAFCLAHMGAAFNDSGKSYKAEDVYTFGDILAKVCKLNVRVEMVGFWIWAFESYHDKDALKAMGFMFSSKHKAWYFNGETYKSKKHSPYNMNQIKGKYGYTVVKERSIPQAIGA